MKIREHRGSLEGSLRTAKDIEPTKAALVECITESLKGYAVNASADSVHIEKYGKGIDDRCGWDTHIVTIDGWGVFGMTDGPLTEEV